MLHHAKQQIHMLIKDRSKNIERCKAPVRQQPHPLCRAAGTGDGTAPLGRLTAATRL